MKQLFTRSFLKYFILTFILAQLIVFLSAGNHYFDQFFIQKTPVGYAFRFCLIASAMLIPTSLCYATGLSCFMTFRHVVVKDTASFFRLLATGLACFAVLAAAVYLYELHVQPGIKGKSMEMMWEIKTSSYYPKPIEKEPGQRSSYWEKPDFTSISTSAMPEKTLRFRTDSIRQEQKKLISECSSMLGSLTSELAKEAYESYNLKELGVDYSYTEKTAITPDSLAYIQQVLLYDKASELAENMTGLKEYHFESFSRLTSPLSIVLTYLIFALSGYFFRSKSMTKLLGWIAILIVSAYLVYSVSDQGNAYIKRVLIHARK